MSGANEKPEDCESCEWPTTELTHYDTFNSTTEGDWLCCVCANTTAGNAHIYKRNYEHSEIVKMIAWQTNYLASLINKPNKGEAIEN